MPVILIVPPRRLSKPKESVSLQLADPVMLIVPLPSGDGV